MLVSVEGCSSPSTLFLVSITPTSSSSASSHRPPMSYAKPTIPMLSRVSSCSWSSTFFLTSIAVLDSCIASIALPLLHAYHAALYISEAHSINESSSLGRCVIADFACGKSIWHLVQFSCSPEGNAAERLLTYCCFHGSSCSLASNHFRIANCTSACISNVWFVSHEINE